MLNKMLAIPNITKFIIATLKYVLFMFMKNLKICRGKAAEWSYANVYRS